MKEHEHRHLSDEPEAITLSLPAWLVTRIGYAAVDRRADPSAFVLEVMRAHFAGVDLKAVRNGR